jgi:urease accessory protein UreF
MKERQQILLHLPHQEILQKPQQQKDRLNRWLLQKLQQQLLLQQAQKRARRVLQKQQLLRAILKRKNLLKLSRNFSVEIIKGRHEARAFIVFLLF